MNGACFQESLVYYATISCNDKNYKPKLYKGSCETSFKKRYSNHKKSFNVPLYKHDTKLSTEYWNVKMKQLNPQISLKMKGIYKSYNPTSKRCNPDLNIDHGLKTLASNMTSCDVTEKDAFTL